MEQSPKMLILKSFISTIGQHLLHVKYVYASMYMFTHVFVLIIWI